MWRFYGYFTASYALDSPGVGQAGGKMFRFFAGTWQDERENWKWQGAEYEEDEYERGQPIHDATYPAYEYNAHAEYLHDCTTFDTSDRCLQKGKDDCHGYRAHMMTKISEHGLGCLQPSEKSFWVRRSTPMYMIQGETFRWDVKYEDDFHCGLIYEDKPIMNWKQETPDDGNIYDMFDLNDLYAEIGHDRIPYYYADDSGKWYNFDSVEFTVKQSGYARIACLGHRKSKGIDERKGHLTFHDESFAWAPPPCVGCEPGMFSSAAGVACIPCEGNTYQDLPNQGHCKPCPLGRTILREGGDLGGTATTTSASTDLLEPLFRSKEDDCEPCPAGEYGLAEGGCGECPAGFFRDTPGAESVEDCAECPIGQFGLSPGLAVECEKCPRGMYTVTSQNIAVSFCLTCASGRYNDEWGLADVQCKACDEGSFQPHGAGGDGSFGIKW